MRGLDIAPSVKMNAHVRTFTHGRGLDTFKTEGELIQDKEIQIAAFLIVDAETEAKCTGKSKLTKYTVQTIFGPLDVCVLDVTETASTAFTVPGSSGGMVVNDLGQLVGVVSAGGEGFSYMVTLSDIQDFVSNY